MQKFKVTGMTCAACSARVEKVTKAVAGVEKAEVNLLAGTMVAEVSDRSVANAIIAEIGKAGYGWQVKIIDENGNIEKIMPKVKPDTNAADILAEL